ncbi:MAG TPA: GNAT family N-acetyltransferase [Usitatibacter sp.]|jgi:ribosomal protein S18 acetylase RimI-like enzyme|nr:GNAT family N-acetyltransferase [Usitatibacter sp.]
MASAVVRPAEARDYDRWRELLDAYTRFYEREPDEAIARHVWSRIVDPKAPVYAAVAEVDGRVVGMTNYLLHESTGTPALVCYLQDLFVDPAIRARGVGEALIDFVLAEMKRHGWQRVYWSTRETNYRARGLYDKYAPHSGFLRYVVPNPDVE